MKQPKLWVMFVVCTCIGLGATAVVDKEDQHPAPMLTGGEAEQVEESVQASVENKVENIRGDLADGQGMIRGRKKYSQEEYSIAIGIVKDRIKELGGGKLVVDFIHKLYEEGYITLEQIEMICDWICAQYPCPPDCPGYYEPPWGR